MFQNQNFEPDPTSHFADTVSESEMAQKRIIVSGDVLLHYWGELTVLSMPMEATWKTELIHHQIKILNCELNKQ